MSEPVDRARGTGLLIIGESLVDLIAEAGSNVFTARAGGSPFNVALGVARLGQPVTFVTEYGDDHCGRILATALAADGVAVRQVRRPTSIAIATLDTSGSATYDFRFEWGLGVDGEIPVRGPFAGLHVGSLACVVEPGRHAVLAAATEAHGLGMAVSYDPNIRPALAPERSVARGIVEQFVAVATVVKASVEDVEWLYPGENPVHRLHQWAAEGDRLVVLTDGPRGCTAVTSSGEVWVPASPVTVVDTIGAGDSFTAALLAHLQTSGELQAAPHLSEDRVRDALAFASRAAAMTCSRAGAYHPSVADLEGYQTQEGKG